MSHFNPLVGIEFERNISDILGQYPDVMMMPRLWKYIAEHGASGLEPIYDIASRMPIGAPFKDSEGAIHSVVNDTGYAELEFPTPVFTDLTEAKRLTDYYFTFLLRCIREVYGDNYSFLGTGSHPMLEPSWENYYQFRTPKGHIYSLIAKGNEHVRGRELQHKEYLTLTSDQPNIDLTPGREEEEFRMLNRIMGLLVALSANSPFASGKLTQWKSLRQHKQYEFVSTARYEVERSMVGMPEIEPDSIEWYLQKLFVERPMMFHGGDKKSHMNVIMDEHGETPSFSQFLSRDEAWKGKTLEGVISDISSDDMDIQSPLQRVCFWNVKPQINFRAAQHISRAEFVKSLHEKSSFQLLLKKGANLFVEVRAIDASLPGEELRMPAFIKGLIVNSKAACRFADSLSYDQWKEIYQLAGRYGMDFSYAGKRASEYCRELYNVSHEGLSNVNSGRELTFIEPLLENIAQSLCPADHLITAYRDGGMQKAIERMTYLPNPI